MYRLREQYNKEIKNKLKEEFGITNVMDIPAVEKVTISVGMGNASKDAKLMQNVEDTISLIAGQKAVTTTAKKSISGFKIREDMPVGVKVTLRGAKMYNFLEKLIAVALPRVKDFRGVTRNGFDGRGNYSFGLSEQFIFPEVVYDDVLTTHGMNIAITTTSEDDKMAYRLLELMGMPFTKARKAGA